uniref:Chromosome partition protein smc n=1 Tax=Nonomuraea gerenzanensis TaxID=93944 RepID=A0A1M4EGN1_9ACTN|nr:hypothetical protein [Nonomuraea gerenzanensis]SBO98131.1 Chromosome partition protein smc [Nonomuraea gerenzanensis]
MAGTGPAGGPAPGGGSAGGSAPGGAALGGGSADGDVSELAWAVPAGRGELVVELRPWFLLRTTGLPVSLLDGLGHPGLRRLSARLLAAERRLAAERSRFERLAAPMRGDVLRLTPDRQARARHCVTSVRTGMPLNGAELELLDTLGLAEWSRRWQSAVVAAGAARAAARSAYAAARLVTRRKVAEAYDDESVRHAAFLADPAFYQAIVRHPLARRPGDGTARRSRLLAATAHRQLRRSTMGGGAGGPVLYARFEPGGGPALLVGEPGPERVVVAAGGWLTRRIGDAGRVEELRGRYAGAPWPERARHFEAARLEALDRGGRAGPEGRPHPHGRAGQGALRHEVFREERSSPYSERVTIGGAALAGVRAALTAALPLWHLATLLAGEPAHLRALTTALDRLASETLARTERLRPAGRTERSGGPVHAHPDVIRLTLPDVARATAELWDLAPDHPAPTLPGPDLMAVGTDLATATWLLCGVRDDCRPLYQGLHAAPVTLTGALPEPWPAHPATGHTRPPEIDLGAHTPRILIGDLIYQRSRWRVHLPQERGADAFDRWLAIHRLCREHHLPRHVFVHHPTDPTPFYVDFCDPAAVEDLARHDPAEVLITELLPAPGRLWWRVDGREQCAQLRLGCVVRRAPR